ncbi:hypothetical protein LCGC14_3063430 [marine sediment metagenome]|uniref:Uncharacterized protein n=1 Tax=marine sediment metagenome TaxID=412755 RepID=A0A0F8WIR0_9ZZZZ
MKFKPRWTWNRIWYAVRHPYRYRVLMRYLKNPPPSITVSIADRLEQERRRHQMAMYGEVWLTRDRSEEPFRMITDA